MFAETFADHARGRPFIVLSEIDSTNNYAMAKLHAGLLTHGTAVHAVMQSAGKGRRGRQWVSPKGENITMSLCLRPVHASFPFLLSASVALGCYDFIKEAGATNVFIKWPNDVYIGDRKAAGLLIETIIRGAWEWAVAGIGMNVNQTQFPSSLSATSLMQVLGGPRDVVASAKELRSFVMDRWNWAEASPPELIMEAYNAVLYRRNSEVRLKRDTAVFMTTIRSVSITGELITEDTMLRNFAVNEVEFI